MMALVVAMGPINKSIVISDIWMYSNLLMEHRQIVDCAHDATVIIT
jgi:hypothetical protein